MKVITSASMREELLRLYQRDLKKAVAEAAFRYGLDNVKIRDFLLDNFDRDDVSSVVTSRVGQLEYSVKVGTREHGTFYYRILVKGEAI